MKWDRLIFLLVLTIVHAHQDMVLNKLINVMTRRSDDGIIMLGEPEKPEDLPKAEPVLPGHALIQPETGMLQSAVKFPQDMSNAVYGNMDQLSVTYGKTPDRILYTGFRKATSLLDSTILQAIRNIQLYNGDDKDSDVVVIQSRAPYYEKPPQDAMNYKPNEKLVFDEENTASEILDESSSLETQGVFHNVRISSALVLKKLCTYLTYLFKHFYHRDVNHRRSKKDKKRKKHNNEGGDILDKYRTKHDISESQGDSTVSASSSDSSDYDKNPGNPYTIYKGKYKQNYMWNHFMDGDHMNINPYGPSFNLQGPSGADLFFGRKWWYFNQDDFKPLG